MSDRRQRNERGQYTEAEKPPAADFDPDDPLFADPPTFASGESDVSHNVDEYVADAIANKNNA